MAEENTVGPNLRRAIVDLLNHIEDNAPDEYWESIDVDKWNAVTYILMNDEDDTKMNLSQPWPSKETNP